MSRKKRIEHHSIVQRFAINLRILRRELGMSQQALAFKALVTPSYIGKLERSEAAPGLDMVGRLAEALGVAPESLVAGEKSTPSANPVIREQILRYAKKLVGRTDDQSLQAIAVVLSLLENALARHDSK